MSDMSLYDLKRLGDFFGFTIGTIIAFTYLLEVWILIPKFVKYPEKSLKFFWSDIMNVFRKDTVVLWYPSCFFNFVLHMASHMSSSESILRALLDFGVFVSLSFKWNASFFLYLYGSPWEVEYTC